MRIFSWFQDRLQHAAQDNSHLDLTPQTRDSLCKALKAENVETVRDLLNSLLLSETIYKVHDLGPTAAVEKLNSMQESFPPGLTDIQKVQCSLPHVHHRYLLATSPKTMFVSFIGTKLAKDVLVDVNMLRSPLWQSADAKQALPAVHRGFLERSQRVPVERLLAQAQSQDKKLLLCGHSLGGAVATLCTLRVLQSAHDAGLPVPPVGCVTFGSPAIGNSALAARVNDNGWKEHFQNVTLPEDLVPRLLSLNPDAASELEASVAKPPPNGGQRSLQQNAGWGRRFGAWRLAPGLRDPIDSGSVAKSWRDSGSKPNLAGAADTTSSADNASPTMDSRHKHRWVWNRIPGAAPRPRSSEQEGLEENKPLKGSDSMSFPVSFRKTPARIAEALPAASSRMPLQGWWKWGSQQEPDSFEAQKSSEEDGAVEVLVSSMGNASGEAPEAVAENRRGWLKRLGQLQNMAASAASTVGGMGSLLPTSIHFGQTIAWPALKSEDLPADVESDVRARLLANHTMPAYRHRALTHVRAATKSGPGGPESCTASMSDDILPMSLVHSAAANLSPLPPPPFSGGMTQPRWAWITSLPYVSSGNAQASDQTLDILIKGEALSAITQGRVLAYGCNWYPVRLLDPPLDPPPLPKRSLRRPGFLDWLASQVSEAGPEPILRAEVVIPMAIAAQVYQGHTGKEGHDLEIHLRSDLQELSTTPLKVRVPTVWLLGTSATAARSIMTAMSQQSAAPRAGTTAHLTPAEVVVDGAKWCNLLAAPVTTPSLALKALTYAMLPNQAAGDVDSRTGPLRLTQQAVQGLQSWLAGPQINLREGSSTSAIVLAVDSSSPLPLGSLKKLTQQAETAGVDIIIADMTSGEETTATSLLGRKGLNRNKALRPEDMLLLRQQVYQALSHGTPLIAKSKL